MMLVQISCLIALQLTVGFASPVSPVVRYDGHKVLEVLHKAEDDFLKILSLEAKYELDFWKMPKHSNDSMKLRVGPNYLEDFLHELEAINADVTTIIEDVQVLIDEEKVHHDDRHARSMTNALNLQEYNSYATIQTYMATLETITLNNDVVAVVESLGFSNEGRRVDMIKLSKLGSPSNKRKIFIDGGIHAREWVAPATVVYIIERLVFNPENNPKINALMELYDVHLVPVVNPDGYQYTNQVRMWRKNRRVNPGTSCVGVDLNRNFPFEWNPAVGGSTNPCSDIYSGPTPDSEPETNNIVTYLNNNGGLFDAYLTIHSFGQMWLYPWGYTSAYPADSADLELAARSATQVAYRYFGTDYIVGPTTETLYSAAGGSDDFAKGGANIKYSYTIELRDTGKNGFLLPKNQIRPTAEEFFQGFLVFAETMHNQISNSGR